MDYRMLGGSGCAVSSLCLGTMTFGAEADEAVAHRQLDRFIEAGGTLVDTADVYAGGRSEEIIGRWCWPPRAVCRWMTRRTAPGCPRAT
jgi:aryl-alcohol dehydrogenase-like predicted oxidoreductase